MENVKESYDANGRHLGKGNGDLNDLHNAISNRNSVNYMIK